MVNSKNNGLVTATIAHRLKAVEINPTSTSRIAMDRYRNLCVSRFFLANSEIHPESLQGPSQAPFLFGGLKGPAPFLPPLAPPGGLWRTVRGQWGQSRKSPAIPCGSRGQIGEGWDSNPVRMDRTTSYRVIPTTSESRFLRRISPGGRHGSISQRK